MLDGRSEGTCTYHHNVERTSAQTAIAMVKAAITQRNFDAAKNHSNNLLLGATLTICAPGSRGCRPVYRFLVLIITVADAD